MRKFLVKTGYFIIPFMCLHVMNNYVYNQNEGDLVRLGYLYKNPSSKSEVSKLFSLPKQYTLVSELNFNQKSTFDIMTIGDSFSEQDSLGYKNFLANEDVSVLHLDHFLSNNPIQKLIELVNGDFFDSIQTNYVVLQSVERGFIQRCETINYSDSEHWTTIQSETKKYKEKTPKRKVDFFSNATLKIPWINLQYYFNDKPEASKTYKVATNTDNLFTGNPKDLLFYQDDYNTMSYKNDSLKAISSNQVINRINDLLQKKNIQLILLISPDKYDIYHPYIKDKQNYTKPMFFKNYARLNKEYLYINSFEILSTEIGAQKDLYYYDDTHWSPKSANIIANEIKKKMLKQ